MALFPKDLSWPPRMDQVDHRGERRGFGRQIWRQLMLGLEAEMNSALKCIGPLFLGWAHYTKCSTLVSSRTPYWDLFHSKC